MSEIDNLKREIDAIKSRNSRVEADKAWEISVTRKVFILIVTYILAALTMSAIGVPDFYLNALVPTLGFFLSTLTLPVAKKWWLQHHRFYE